MLEHIQYYKFYKLNAKEKIQIHESHENIISITTMNLKYISDIYFHET